MYLNFILIITFFFIKCQTNKEIPSIFLNYSDHRNISFDLCILKDEIFEIQYYGNPSTGSYWSFVNFNSFKNTYIQSVTKPNRLLNEKNNTENDFPELIEIESEIESQEFNQILGSPEISYGYYKALKTTNEPLILIFNYISGSNVIVNNSINLNIYDELNDSKCIKNEKEEESNEVEENEKEEESNKVEENEKEEESNKVEKNEKEEDSNKVEKNEKEEEKIEKKNETQLELQNNIGDKIEEEIDNENEKFTDNFKIINLSFSLFYLLFLF